MPAVVDLGGEGMRDWWEDRPCLWSDIFFFLLILMILKILNGKKETEHYWNCSWQEVI